MRKRKSGKGIKRNEGILWEVPVYSGMVEGLDMSRIWEMYRE